MKTHNELPLFVIDEFLRLRFWPAMLKSVEINFIKIILVFPNLFLSIHDNEKLYSLHKCVMETIMKLAF